MKTPLEILRIYLKDDLDMFANRNNQEMVGYISEIIDGIDHKFIPLEKKQIFNSFEIGYNQSVSNENPLLKSNL